MTWELFCKNNLLSPKFQKASIENLSNDLKGHKKQLIAEWVHNPTSLVIYGDVGRGKTAFMFTLIREALKKYPLWDFRLEKAKIMDDKMTESIRAYGTAAEICNKLKHVPYLFLDDLGTEKIGERTQRELSDILDHRYNFEYKTVITTNLDESAMQQTYGDRIFSRLGGASWVEMQSHEDMRQA